VAHEVTWKGKSIADLAGQVVRLEILLTKADLYTIRAGGPPASRPRNVAAGQVP
jgi:hypothetical protein